MNSVECPVCFCPGESFLMCSNGCDYSMCLMCVDSYFALSKRENRIPVCLGCEQPYLYSYVLKIRNNDNIVANYVLSCINKYMNKSGNEISSKIAIKNQMDSLRNERVEYLSGFPSAILLTARIAMKTHLNKIDSDIKGKLSKEVTGSRFCMNLICNGKLISDESSETLVCTTCQTQFCTKCELVKESGHVCNESEVESINVLKESVRCPKCSLPVFRASGCDHMTCSNCGEYFLYSTGEEGGAGNHQFDKIAAPRTYNLLSNVHSEYIVSINLMEKVILFESFKPKNPTESSLNNILAKYVKSNNTTDENKHKYGKMIAYEYEKYFLGTSKHRQYIRLSMELEKLMINKTLTPVIIDEFIRRLI